MQKSGLVKLGLFLGDIAVIQVALFLTLFFRDWQLLSQFNHFAYHFLPVHGVWLAVLFILNMYDVYFFKKLTDFIFNVVIFTVGSFFTATAYFYFLPTPNIAPKTILLLHIAIFSGLFFIWRYLFNRFFLPKSSGTSHELQYKKIPLNHLSEEWFLANVGSGDNRMYQIIKRCIDLIIGAIGFIIFLIAFPFIALAIILDSSGDILYRQQRVGQFGRVFTISKFRSMKQDGNQDKQVWRENSQNTITRTGAILRRLHLDELPQAWSLVKGDISFVGPRPEWIELAKTFEKEIPFYTKRYLIKPGIIGWAQINYPPSRSLDQVKEKFEYDLYYLKNRSLLLDFEIILKAVKLFLW